MWHVSKRIYISPICRDTYDVAVVRANKLCIVQYGCEICPTGKTYHLVAGD
jgi:hypothetical protein